jgi:hypothetical protein
MTLQHSLYQVMRLLTDKTVDTKRVALMLYALQIAASNLKRLHQETAEIATAAGDAEETSLVKLFLQELQIPETPEELAAEFAAQCGAHDYLNPIATPAAHAASNAPVIGDSQPNRPSTGSTDHSIHCDIKACAEEPPYVRRRKPCASRREPCAACPSAPRRARSMMDAP